MSDGPGVVESSRTGLWSRIHSSITLLIIAFTFKISKHMVHTLYTNRVLKIVITVTKINIYKCPNKHVQYNIYIHIYVCVCVYIYIYS